MTTQFTIIGSERCGYSIAARNLLRNTNPRWIDVESQEGQLIRQTCKNNYKFTTIPMIFVNDQFIGGYDDLVKLKSKKETNDQIVKI